MKAFLAIIFFSFGYSDLIQAQSANSPELPKPIKTVVIPKTISNAKPEWRVYADVDMNTMVRTVVPGDTVEIVGWAPRLFKIKNGKKREYISRLAVEVVPDLKPLAEKIEIETSRIEAALEKEKEKELAKINPTPIFEYYKMDSDYWDPVMGLVSPPTMEVIKERVKRDSADIKARYSALRLSVSKNKIAVGECAFLEISFNVHPDNKRPLQFYELGEQLGRIIPNLPDSLYLKSDRWIRDVPTEIREIGSLPYSVYPIYQAAICPMKAKPIVFRPVELMMRERVVDLKTKKLKPESEFLPAPYKTTPLTIQVVPKQGARESEQFELTGKFVLLDSIQSKNVTTGKEVRYSATVMGTGMTFPLEPPKITSDSIHWSLDDEQVSDTLIEEQYYSRKTFIYTLTFKKPGNYNLSSYLNFSAFDLKKNEYTKLASSKTVTVTGGAVKLLEYRQPLRQSMIAMDFSQSMDVEDYKPSRLEVAKKGVADFLVLQKNCDLGLLIFGGDVHLKNVATGDSCFSKNKIRALNRSELKSGTAIGDAIWTAMRKIDKTKSTKKIIIIGDGDNTAGYFNASLASKLAKEKNIVVYTIGVGTPGLVPYGRDPDGKPYMIANTFSDIELKKIAARTGGKYFLAKDAADVTRILKEIFGK